MKVFVEWAREYWWAIAVGALAFLLLVVIISQIAHVVKKRREVRRYAKEPIVMKTADNVEIPAPTASQSTVSQSTVSQSTATAQPTASNTLVEDIKIVEEEAVEPIEAIEEVEDADDDDDIAVDENDYGDTVVALPKITTQKYRVTYDRLNPSWIIKKDGNERVTRRVATKVEAMKIAKELCKHQDINMDVHKKNGKFQKQ